MRILIHARGTVLTNKLHSYVERCLHQATRRFEKQLGTVTVHLEDVNGPRGGMDKLCLITAELPWAGHVVIEERGEGFMGVAFWAAKRLRDTIKRRVQRRRKRFSLAAGFKASGFAAAGGAHGRGW
jgi:putative sigma-54 modulation protein